MEKGKTPLGTKLKFIRELKGYSQEAIALHLGISQQAYQKLESGKCRICEERLHKIAGFLGLQAIQLLQFDRERILAEFKKQELDSFKQALKLDLMHVQAELERLRTLNQRLIRQLEQNETRTPARNAS